MNDPAATTVYGELLWRHMNAARKDFHGPERARIYKLIEDFEKEFPEECKIWNDRYTVEDSSNN